MSGKVVAVAGATGAVGAEMLKVLEDRDFPVSKIKMLASHRSVGKELEFRGEKHAVEELGTGSFKGVDIALFSCGGGRSKEFAPAAVADGCVVVDNSSAFRLDDDVPLVVPEINAEAAKGHKGIIANPNCSTIIADVAIWPIHKAVGVKRVVCATYQATSGAGAKGMAELKEQVAAIEKGEAPNIEFFAHQIAFNLIPSIGGFTENGYSTEEMKLLNETRKIFGDDSVNVSCTTVRVPVYRAHSEAINLELRGPLSVEDARGLIDAAPGVELVDDIASETYPMPLDASGKYDVLVGRIRKDESVENGLDMWVSGDQLLKGAALNAVQIAELL